MGNTSDTGTAAIALAWLGPIGLGLAPIVLPAVAAAEQAEYEADALQMQSNLEMEQAQTTAAALREKAGIENALDFQSAIMTGATAGVGTNLEISLQNAWRREKEALQVESQAEQQFQISRAGASNIREGGRVAAATQAVSATLGMATSIATLGLSAGIFGGAAGGPSAAATQSAASGVSSSTQVTGFGPGTPIGPDAAGRASMQSFRLRPMGR